MTQPILAVLQEKGVVLSDAQPMKSGQYGLTGGVPIIDVPQNPRGEAYDFMVYDNSTSPDGRTLIQGEGTQFAVQIRDDGFRVVDRKKISGQAPFGVIGVYPDDYYMASRQFVSDLEEMCE